MPQSHPDKTSLAPDASSEPLVIDASLLREWPLPQPDVQGDKEHRGRVLVVGGSPEVPGAVLLTGEAALRAGVGKLRFATPSSLAVGMGLAVPEARVYALPEAESGAIVLSAADLLVRLANDVQCVVFGPGLLDETATTSLLQWVLPQLDGPTVVLDAAALACLTDNPTLLNSLNGNAVVTPHAGEMASLLGMEKAAVNADPITTARRASTRFGCVVALKGAETIIAAPSGECYCNRTGNVGLATSGSGDTLAGIVGGLAARGADPLQAAVWGVHLHACAGDRLAQRIGPLGFLARELLSELPPLLAKFGS